MPFSRPATCIAIFALTALSLPAAAQIPVTPAPDAWTVFPNPDQGMVRISKTATDGTTTFVGGCNRASGPGFTGIFTRYAGGGLRTDGTVERVLFAVSGEEWKEMFSAQLRYTTRSGGWEIDKVLAPVFVNSFSRGSKLTVLNSRWEEVASFDLTGSSAAARTMRSVCGFP